MAQVEVDVTNHSPDRAGATVVQLYFQQAVAPVIRYYQQLVRYEKVHVAAGATITVSLPLKISDMAYWDDKEGGYLPGKRGWALGRPGVIHPSRTSAGAPRERPHVSLAGMAGTNVTYHLMAGLSAAECNGGEERPLQALLSRRTAASSRGGRVHRRRLRPAFHFDFIRAASLRRSSSEKLAFLPWRPKDAHRTRYIVDRGGSTTNACFRPETARVLHNIAGVSPSANVDLTHSLDPRPPCM